MTDGRTWGIQPGYHDDRGGWREVPLETVDRVLASMGATDAGPPASSDNLVVLVEHGQAKKAAGIWTLQMEDGSTLSGEGVLPPDLPVGYHRLCRLGEFEPALLIVAPPACHLPSDLRIWGWAVQLYATRSKASWGMGDLNDLARLGEWSAGQGAGMAMLNPLHAALPSGPQQASPYSPSSRCFRSPLYLRIEDVDGAMELADLAALAAAGRALNAERLIDRDAVWLLKAAALEQLWQRFTASGGHPAFTRYCEEQGQTLIAYATFCALVEKHGRPWTSWPVGLRQPTGAGVHAFAVRERDRILYHQWVQWLVDQQLQTAGARIALVQDLAIGVDPDGADAWLWQDCFALDIRVGAPPDEFAMTGQNWGLPPFDPFRLRAAFYEPFIATLRAALRHAGGLRIDHVMGLFRLFWIPLGMTAAEGAYVEYPWHDLLAILAVESHRAGAWIVGEDLGTVEPFVRHRLANQNVLSYRLAYFEPNPPRRFPLMSMAAVTTHDLPTLPGLWTGSDLVEQAHIGLEPNVPSTEGIRRQLEGWTGCASDGPADEVVRRIYGLLAEAPSMVVAATLDDALGVLERPNLPGTTTERPNWCLALPKTLDDIASDPGVNALAEIANQGRGSRPEAGA